MSLFNPRDPNTDSHHVIEQQSAKSDLTLNPPTPGEASKADHTANPNHPRDLNTSKSNESVASKELPSPPEGAADLAASGGSGSGGLGSGGLGSGGSSGGVSGVSGGGGGSGGF